MELSMVLLGNCAWYLGAVKGGELVHFHPKNESNESNAHE